MKSNIYNEQGIAHLAIIGMVVAALVGGTGYVVYKAGHKSSNLKSSETSSALTSSLAQPLPTDLLTVDKVKQLAALDKPNSTILGVELENENGVLVYKIKLSDGKILVINAKSGSVVTNTSTASLEGETTLPANVTPVIDYVKARALALAQHSGTIQKIELEMEDGVLSYNVRFTDNSRVDINATDGSIIKTSHTDSTNKTSHDVKDKANEDNTTKSDQPQSGGSTTTQKGNSGNSGSHDSSSSSTNGSSSNSSSSPTEVPHSTDSTSNDSHQSGSSGSGSGSNSGSGSGH